MMKKLLLLLTLTVSSAATKAQCPVAVVNDTLHYYFNKYYFKTGGSMDTMPYFLAPAATATLAAHVGSKFENNEPIDISGLEAIFSRNGSSTNPVINVHLYLCNMKDGLPEMPPIDSVMLKTSGTTELFTGPTGGRFKNDTVYRLNGDFAVLLRNMSTLAGDSVRVARTSGVTLDSPESQLHKYSDGFGFVRQKDKFYSTNNFSAKGFGTGTAYEFCVAPWVQYTLTLNHEVAPNATAFDCVYTPMVFTNQSSWRFMQRQYNLIMLKERWDKDTPFNPSTLQVDRGSGPENVFTSDKSGISWYFAPEDDGKDKPFPLFYLPANSPDNKVTFYTDSSATSLLTGGDSSKCFYSNEFRTRLITMRMYGKGEFLACNDTFVICTQPCGERVGLDENRGFADLKVFPNPSSGKTIITGLEKGTTLGIYDLLGQKLRYEAVEQDRVEIDMSGYASGTYLIKVQSGYRARTVRFVKN